MCARANKQIARRLQNLQRDAQVCGEDLGKLCMPCPHIFEKPFTVFAVFWRGVYLAHKAVFFAMFFGGAVRHFPQNLPEICGRPRRVFSKIVYDRFHAIGGRFDDDLIFRGKIMEQIAAAHSARFSEVFYGSAVDPVFAKTTET